MHASTEPRRPAELGEPPVVISYQNGIAWIAPGVLGLAAVIGLFWLVAAIGHPGAPVWFGLLWYAGLGWLAFEIIWRQARSVVVVNGSLYWTNWLRQEHVALTGVIRMSVSLGGFNQVIECRDGRRLHVAINWGYGRFIRELRAAYPDLDIAWAGYSWFGPK